MQQTNDTALRVAAVLLACASVAGAQQIRAFWADAFHYGFKNPAEVDRMIDDVTAARANAIIAEVRRDSESYYLKSVEPPAQDAAYSPGFDALQYLIDHAHARGIEVHAWFPVTPLWRSAAPPLDSRHLWFQHGPNAEGPAMWMSVSSAGKISQSLDPGHPAALRYLADLIVGVARNYDIDGIHLDYIRYPEDADYGWNPTAVDRFNLQYNRTGSPPPRDPSWSEFRRAQVTALVRQIYLRTFAIKPAVKVSAAVITWGNGPVSDQAFLASDAYSRIFQDWRGWLEEGILDLAIPMNYFRESANSAFLDRWINFERDRQYRRATLIGLGNYLNSIPESVAQLTRALMPSAGGSRLDGVAFYSYASTNTLTPAGAPSMPNADFYSAVADFFGAPASVPALPWKATPDRGHVSGQITVNDDPGSLRDGATVWIESAANAYVSVRTVSDGTGFFGAVDLPPGVYFARLERGGVEIARTNVQSLGAGEIVHFDFTLTAADFVMAWPKLNPRTEPAAPGEVVTLTGQALSDTYAPARSVPLPAALSRTQVLVNGTPAPLYSVDRDRIVLQLPYEPADFNVVVRRDGLASAAITLTYTPARPVIAGVYRNAGGYLEIYATGLGAVDPPIPAGLGGPAAEPYPRVVAPLPVRINGQEVPPVYMGLQPYEPGKYQVNVKLPVGVTAGQVTIGDSAPAAFE